ncbi:hypothetical protein Nm8I071_00010 [Nonomuraea sp. TT08I-71]|nr:hypothetical protein Nm8I071_00010 [Nonomuraea sp. TT08I-71]
MARAALRRGRAGLAFAATSVALALPVPLVGAALWPRVLVATADGAASQLTGPGRADGGRRGRERAHPGAAGWLALPLVPALLGFQAMCWWVFRGRTDGQGNGVLVNRRPFDQRLLRRVPAAGATSPCSRFSAG